MSIKFFISAIALTIFTTSSHAWTLIYSHDANGTPTMGSLEALRNAASNGSSIKVVVISSGSHDWQLSCSQVSVKTDGTQEVVCFHKMDLWTQSKTGPQFGSLSSPPQFLNFTINTLGQYSQTSIQISNGAVLYTNTLRFPIRWYAQ